MNIICFTFYLYNGKSLLYYISISYTIYYSISTIHYHIFVIFLGLGPVVCLIGKDLNSQVQ